MKIKLLKTLSVSLFITMTAHANAQEAKLEKSAEQWLNIIKPIKIWLNVDGLPIVWLNVSHNVN